MALTEQKKLAAVNHNIIGNTLEVKWLNEVLRNGEVISSIPHRCAYGVDQKAQFETDLGADAARYIALAGW